MAIFVAFYEYHTLDAAHARTHRYGQFLEMPLWNLDERSARENLNLIARTGEYGAIAVYHQDGTPFVRVDGERNPGPFDRLFGALGVVRSMPLSQPILYGGQPIGRIDAIWVNRNIFAYLYGLAFCLLGAMIIRYYVQLAQSRYLLESNNQSLVQEVRERQRTQAQLQHAHEQLEHRVAERTLELASANQALSRENLERQRTQEHLSTSLGEKEVLLKEVHHRVKNNLQVVISMLRLQGDRMGDPRAMLQESINRVTAMSLIHEKLYHSASLAHIDFGNYIRSLTSDLVHSYAAPSGQIQCEIVADRVDLQIDQAIPCGLIINELVSNALKHAFPNRRQGRIYIELAADGDEHLLLVIRDDGVGIPANFDISKSDSLGMQLVHSLARQLGGSIDIDTRSGTCFAIRFKR